MKKEALYNDRNSYWNKNDCNGIKNITTFDLLFYDNPIPLIYFILYSIIGNDNPTEKDFFKLKEILIKGGQEELAKSISFE